MVVDKIQNSLQRPRQEGISPKNEAVIDKEVSFPDILERTVKSIETMQQEVNKNIEGVVKGSHKVMPHQAIIALEKADLAFQLMNQVRTKIVRAYEEIMRTPV